MSRRQGPQFDREQLRITRGAAILLGLEVGLTLVWMFLDDSRKATLAPWLLPSGETVWQQGHVWTLITGPLITTLGGLFMDGLMLWLFLPQLERWWGTGRFLRFAAATAIAGTVAGTLFGLLVGRAQFPILGLTSFIWAGTVAFGIVFARQAVRLFAYLPMTGRQLMYGMLAFLALYVLLQGAWELGASYVAAIGVAVLLTNQRWNPRLAWLRWKKKRARAHLSVLAGGERGGAKPKKKPEQWLN